MTRLRLTPLVVAFAIAGTALGAQPPAKAKKEATPQSDSIKALKRTLKYDKADARKAKETGDTAKALQLREALKLEKQRLAKLQGKDTIKKDSTKKAKKPPHQGT